MFWTLNIIYFLTPLPFPSKLGGIRLGLRTLLRTVRGPGRREMLSSQTSHARLQRAVLFSCPALPSKLGDGQEKKPRTFVRGFL